MEIQIIQKGHEYFSVVDEENMYRLRFDVFHERLGWEVKTAHGMEFDEFDAMDPVYVLVRDGAEIMGCWRMLPTTGPNMLRDVFPELADGDAVPESHQTWELSRFAARSASQSGYGLTTAPTAMMYHAVRFARSQGVTEFVTVTNVGVERMLRHLGLKPRRLGRPRQIGVEHTVALAFVLDDAAEDLLHAALVLRAGPTELMAAPAHLEVPARLSMPFHLGVALQTRALR